MANRFRKKYIDNYDATDNQNNTNYCRKIEFSA